MSDRPPPSLAATCTGCGGTVPLTLSGPPPACPYCDAEAPLEPALARRVAGLRKRLATQARRERQLVGKQAELGQTFGYCFLGAILCVWVVIGGGLALWPLLEPPPGWTAWQYLTTEYRGKEWIDDHVMMWWASFSVVLGFWLTVTLWLALLVSLRRVVRWAYPLPPDAPGGAPRCRCCGAELGSEGVIRRCGFCDADHVVAGARYQRREAALEERLEALEAQLEETLAARNQRIDRLMGVAGGLPLVVALFAPLLGLVFTRTDPRMWGFVGLLIVTSALLVVWCERWRPPEIPSFEFLQAGDRVFLRGEPRTVLGILDLERKGVPPLHLVGAEEGTPTAAFLVKLAQDGEPSADELAVRVGGEPLTAEDIPKGARLDLRRDRGVGALAGRETVWGIVGQVVGRVPREVRLVLGKPRAGEPPSFTATHTGELSEADLSLFPVGPRANAAEDGASS